jgi:HAD superfamily hydrolase (TIGR01490 family)
MAAKTGTSRARGARRKVAVFDIDGTIFRSSLLIECVTALIGTGTFPARARQVYAAAHRRWLERKGGYEDYIDAVVRAFRRYIVGVSEADFLMVVRQVVRAQRRRVYRYTRDLVSRLRRRGYFLLAVSHSPKHLVDHFARALGFDKIYGRVLALDAAGRFTGKVLHADVISAKGKVLRRAIAKEHLTLAGSVGVGDTEADVGFLELVEHPICFNPNLALYRIAQQRPWRVVVERKDVIYDARVAGLGEATRDLPDLAFRRRGSP